MGGRTFVLDEHAALTPLQQVAYELEEVLQLLAEHHDLLAGDQMREGEPRRWLLIMREAGVPGEEAHSSG